MTQMDSPDKLPEGIFDDQQGNYYFYCNRCDAKVEWPEEPESFEYRHPHNLCGGSPWCCP